jgi:hypothetical protein
LSQPKDPPSITTTVAKGASLVFTGKIKSPSVAIPGCAFRLQPSKELDFVTLSLSFVTSFSGAQMQCSILLHKPGSHVQAYVPPHFSSGINSAFVCSEGKDTGN